MSRMLDALRAHNGVSLSPDEAPRRGATEENVLASLGYPSNRQQTGMSGALRIVLAAVLVVVTLALLWQVAVAYGLLPAGLLSGVWGRPSPATTSASAVPGTRVVPPPVQPASPTPSQATPSGTEAPGPSSPASPSAATAATTPSAPATTPAEPAAPVARRTEAAAKPAAPVKPRPAPARQNASEVSDTPEPQRPAEATGVARPGTVSRLGSASDVVPRGASIVPPIYRTSAGEVDRFKLALYYHRNGDFENALVQYRAVLEVNELNAEAHNNLGLLYQDKGLYDEAIREFRRATFIDPQYYKAHNNLGVALLKSGKIDAAVNEFKWLVAQDGLNIEAMTNLASAQKAAGRSEDARETLHRVLSNSQDYAPAHYNLALIHEEAGELVRAIEHYEKFIAASGAENAAAAADVRRRVDTLRAKLIGKH